MNFCAKVFIGLILIVGVLVDLRAYDKESTLAKDDFESLETYLHHLERQKRFLSTDALKEILSDLQHEYSDDPFFGGMSAIIEGHIFQKDSEYENSSICFNKALEMAQEHGYENLKSIAYRGLGENETRLSQFASADSLIGKAIDLSLELEDPFLIAEAKFSGAILFHFKGELEEALEYYLQSLELAEAHDMIHILDKIYNNIGDVYHSLVPGSVHLAELYLDKGIEASRRLNLPTTVTMLTKGQIYFHKGMFSKAQECLESSLREAKELNNFLALGQIYKFLAITCFEQDRLNDALLYYQSLNALALDMDRLAYLNLSHVGQVICESLIDKVELSTSKIQSLTEMIDTTVYLKSNVDGYWLISKYLFVRNRYPEAIDIYKDFIEEFSDIDLSLVTKARGNLVKCYQKMGRSRSAFKEIKTLNVQLSNDLRDQTVKELIYKAMDTEYEGKRKKLIQELNEEASKNITRLKRNRTLIFSASTVFVTLIILALVIKHSAQILKDVNDNLKSKKSKQENLLEVKNKVLSILGHEMRTPISALANITSVLSLSKTTVPEINDYLGILKSEIHTTRFSLQNLRNWSRSQMEESHSQREVVKPHAIVEGLKDTFAFVLSNKQLSLVNEIHPGTSVLADYDKLKIVLSNVIGNAIKFSYPESSIEVRTEQMSDMRIGIYIRDHGIGMSETQVEELFRSSTNRSKKGTAGESGTGLGLLLCKELMEDNEGQIYVRSWEGQGTVITLSLPTTKRSKYYED